MLVKNPKVNLKSLMRMSQVGRIKLRNQNLVESIQNPEVKVVHVQAPRAEIRLVVIRKVRIKRKVKDDLHHLHRQLRDRKDANCSEIPDY